MQKRIKQQTYTLHNPTINYQEDLNPEQLKVVQSGDGPCLVLAGAGSGKTRTLVYRVAWLIEHGISPDNILLLTFTNKAAREMLSRANSLVKKKTKGLWGGTFHHTANRLLRIYAKKIGFRPNFQILDQDDAQRLIKSIVTQLKGPVTDRTIPKADAVHRIISFSVNSNLPLSDVLNEKFPHFLQHKPLIAQVQKDYQKQKLTMNVMDFDDLLVYLLKLLENPDIRKKISKRFQYVLVDEYQDTNHLQAQITYHLASYHNNLLVVGDDAQSIYSFRAADVDNILFFAREYPKTKTFRLETNYRSRPEILTLANKSIINNTARHDKKLRGIRKFGSTPIVAATPDTETQASYITDQIISRTENSSLNKLAVLFRASHHTLELELELSKRDIPYIKRGGLRYFEQAHVKDVLAYLRILTNPADEIAWRRVLLLYEGIGARTSEQIISYIRSNPLEFLKLMEQASQSQLSSSRAVQGIKQIYNLLKKLAVENPRPGDLITTILTHYYNEYAKSAFDDSEDRLLDLETLANFANRYDTVQSLLADASLGEGFRGEINRNEKMQEDDYLIISTIHQAKGLEWKTVFLMGLADGHFPNARSLMNSRDLEEERRLFYVAVTRAKDELIITYPETSYLSSGYLLGRPSLFIRELPKNVYEKWEIEDSNSLTDNFDETDIDDL